MLLTLILLAGLGLVGLVIYCTTIITLFKVAALFVIWTIFLSVAFGAVDVAILCAIPATLLSPWIYDRMTGQ